MAQWQKSFSAEVRHRQLAPWKRLLNSCQLSSLKLLLAKALSKAGHILGSSSEHFIAATAFFKLLKSLVARGGQKVAALPSFLRERSGEGSLLTRHETSPCRSCGIY